MKSQNSNTISRVVIALLIVFYGANIGAQGKSTQAKASLSWYNPSQSTISMIEGRGWNEHNSIYTRLPSKAKSIVRKPVWNLSRNSSGLVLRFKTNAARIVVRYQVTGELGMPHMPPTGVSGVDLYSIDKEGKQMWTATNRILKDTLVYDYRGINPNAEYSEYGMEYRLYLPLYNTVKWMEIGVESNDKFEFLPIRNQKPIVVYGTSIAQGACASRPGMAWPSIIGRKLNAPLINLGFSGQGKLDKEMIELIAELDASIYILDCLPNMTAPRFTNQEVRDRIVYAVNYLQDKRPNVPILFTEHDGYTDSAMRPERRVNYKDINIIMRKTFAEMKQDGICNIFLLPHDEINMDLDCQVDGIHPNDLGMFRYAQAYLKYINLIFGK